MFVNQYFKCYFSVRGANSEKKVLFIQKRLLYLLKNKQSESGIDRNHKNLIPYVPKLIPLDFVGDIF